jgi:hypothetical protein
MVGHLHPEAVVGLLLDGHLPYQEAVAALLVADLLLLDAHLLHPEAAVALLVDPVHSFQAGAAAGPRVVHLRRAGP